MIEYILILVTTAIFGIQHSGMSAHKVKYKIIDKWGKEAYSRIFTWTSIGVFLLAFLSVNYWGWIDFILNPSVINWPIFSVGIGMILVGLIVALRASSVISVSTVADMQTDRQPELVTDGIYSRIRHPLYLATVLIFLSLIPLYMEPHVALFGIAMSAYTLIGAYLEEKKLIDVYGTAYLDYRRRAGFILPRIRKSSE